MNNFIFWRFLFILSRSARPFSIKEIRKCARQRHKRARKSDKLANQERKQECGENLERETRAGKPTLRKGTGIQAHYGRNNGRVKTGRIDERGKKREGENDNLANQEQKNDCPAMEQSLMFLLFSYNLPYRPRRCRSFRGTPSAKRRTAF